MGTQQQQNDSVDINRVSSLLCQCSRLSIFRLISYSATVVPCSVLANRSYENEPKLHTPSLGFRRLPKNIVYNQSLEFA